MASPYASQRDQTSDIPCRTTPHVKYVCRKLGVVALAHSFALRFWSQSSRTFDLPLKLLKLQGLGSSSMSDVIPGTDCKHRFSRAIVNGDCVWILRQV